MSDDDKKFGNDDPSNCLGREGDSSQVPATQKKLPVSRQSSRENKIMKTKTVDRQDSRGEGDSPNIDVKNREKKLSQDKIEDNKIRERIKSMPLTKKDVPIKKKGPLLAKHSKLKESSSNAATTLLTAAKIAPGCVPRYQKRRHLSPRGESAFTRHIVNSNPSSRNVSPNISAKGKNMSPVNPTRIPLPDRKSSPIPPASTSSQILQVSAVSSRRPQSPNTDTTLANIEAPQKRIEKVKRARLYLLQQIGPNSFLIGGDSPDHKYRVIIGAQQCSCGKGPHCLHVLFVMLRVFQVKENNPTLLRKTLKNYEVEALFKTYHARRTSKLGELKKNRKSKPKIDPSIEKTDEGEEVDNQNQETAQEDQQIFDHDSQGTDDDNCPICLLDMVEGESLVECTNGCQNKLHHHCIDIWFQNCKRQKERLTCPLCRIKWPSEHEVEEIPGPPNTRATSPIPPSPREAEIELPHVEPLSEEHWDTATPWISFFGENLVACMFSRHWSDREISLKQLGRVTYSNLISSAETDQSILLSHSATSQMPSDQMLNCCCEVLAYMLRDPVYRVFVAALKSLRTVLGYTPCRNEAERDKMETLLQPIVESILLKCADSNKKMSLLSISAIQELSKGQEGELSLGRELENPGNNGIDGIEYILKCVTKDYDQKDCQWQWLLGRFYVIDNLIEEYPREFIVHRQLDKAMEFLNEPQVLRINMDRVKIILSFVIKFLTFTHSKVEKLARRIYYCIAKLQVHDHVLFNEVLELLSNVDVNMQVLLKRKLLKTQEEYLANNQTTSNLSEFGLVFNTELLMDDLDPIFTTPVMSPTSSPRSLSPEPSNDYMADIDVVIPEVNHQWNVPVAPPNSPSKYETRRSGKDGPNKNANITGYGALGVSKKLHLVEPGSLSTPDNSSVLSKGSVKTAIEGPAGLLTPPPTPLVVINNDTTEPSNIRRLQDIPESNRSNANHLNLESSYNLLRISPQIDASDSEYNKPQDLNLTEFDSEKIIQHKSVYQPFPNSDHEDLLSFASEPSYDNPLNSTNEDIEDTVTDYQTTDDEPFLNNANFIDNKEKTDGQKLYEGETRSIRDTDSNPVSLLVVDDDQFSSSSDVVEKTNSSERSYLNGRHSGEYSIDGDASSNHSNEGIADKSLCDPKEENEETTNEQSLNRTRNESTGSVSSTQANASSQTGNLTDDFSEILSPQHTKERVSFKTEIASSPKHGTPQHSPDQQSPEGTLEACPCKEEVEKEEAQALVAAMEQSHLNQSKLPFVPGLSADEDETLTIHVQQESTDGLPEPMHSYMESDDWTKGPMLGTGAFSTCYQARDNKTGTLMCVKQISFCRNSASEQEDVVKAVKEEIQMMAKLHHPNVVRILGATQQGCHFFMFVEWMPGGSISYLLDLYGAFSKDVMVSYTSQILRGLAYLHDNHILHRDLKGANLLVDSTGHRLRIADFGASARLASKQTGAGEFQGQLLGTIAFMAPEVLRGESYGRSCDIWSVGCVIIEMANTKPPWGASALSNHLALIFKIASTFSSPPVPENLFPPLRDLTLRCLEVNRDERPTAKDLLQHPLFTMDKR